MILNPKELESLLQEKYDDKLYVEKNTVYDNTNSRITRAIFYT